MSFDYPLEHDDNEAFFKITAKLTFTYLSEDVSVPINQTVTIGTIEDTGIGSDNKNFAIPVDLSFPISAIERMELKSATIEVLNPNSKYIYTNPTSFETITAEYVAVTSNLYMDNSQFGSYHGIFNADLYNSSQGILTMQYPISREFSADTQPYLNVLSTTWAKRTDLVSSLTRPDWKLYCVDKGGMASNMYMGVSYYITSYFSGGEIDTVLSAVENIPIPIVSGQSQTVVNSNYIDESIIGSYLIFNIHTYLR